MTPRSILLVFIYLLSSVPNIATAQPTQPEVFTDPRDDLRIRAEQALNALDKAENEALTEFEGRLNQVRTVTPISEVSKQTVDGTTAPQPIDGQTQAQPNHVAESEMVGAQRNETIISLQDGPNAYQHHLTEIERRLAEAFLEYQALLDQLEELDWALSYRIGLQKRLERRRLQRLSRWERLQTEYTYRTAYGEDEYILWPEIVNDGAAERRVARMARRTAERRAARMARRAAERRAARLARRAAERIAARMARRAAKRRTARMARRAAERRTARMARRAAERRTARMAKRAAKRRTARMARRAAERRTARMAKRAAKRRTARMARRAAERRTARMARRAADRSADRIARRVAERPRRHPKRRMNSQSRARLKPSFTKRRSGQQRNRRKSRRS